MNEWKELKVDDLPGDILVGDYEFEYLSNGYWLRNKRIEKSNVSERGYVLLNATTNYRYRKCQPKAPSHEEIMTKWWKTDNNNCWVKPVQYFNGYYGIANTVFNSPVKNQPKEWFIGRESADIPPE